MLVTVIMYSPFLLTSCPVARLSLHWLYWSSNSRAQFCSTFRCLASLIQSIIASEMAGAVETTSSGAGLGGCSEVRSGGNGEVEKSWHCFSVTAQNTISGSQGPGINDLCLSATVAHCAGATDKKKKAPTSPDIWQQSCRSALYWLSAAGGSSSALSVPGLWLTSPCSGRGLLLGMHCAYFLCWLVSMTGREVLSVPAKLHSRCCLM